MTSILLVEDDEYKASDLSGVVTSVSPKIELVRAPSVTSALRAVAQDKFALIILDMSLPTFDLSGPGGGGSPEGQGGVEVLRLARRLKNNSPFVVVTQYPDIDINGKEVSLPQAASALSLLFNVHVMDCLLYDFDDDAWRDPLKNIISEVTS